MSGKGFGKAGKGYGPPAKGFKGFDADPYSQGSARKMELVAKVKELQRSDPDNKKKWEAFCLKQGVSKLDPAFHDENYLSTFLAQLQNGELEVIESEEKIALVMKVKAAQRTSPESKQAWYDYVALAGSSHYDPNRHDETFLAGFFTFLETGRVPINEKDKNRAHKVFVGGLEKTGVDEEALLQHFSQFGTVTKVELKYDSSGFRGFAFVSFETAEAAQAVIDNGEANEFQGKFIDCKSAQPPPASSTAVTAPVAAKGGAKPAAPKGGAVAGSWDEWSGAGAWDSWGAGSGGWDEWGSSGWDDWDWDMESMMSWMAMMMAMKGQSKGKGKDALPGKGPAAPESYGKAAYGKEGAYSKDGPYGKGKGKGDEGKGKGKAASKLASKPPPAEGAHQPTAETIFVGGCPVDVTKEALNEYFSQFGFVKAVQMKYDPEGNFRGFAFVTFNDADAANAVLANHELNMINGKWVDCKLAGPPPVYNNSAPRSTGSKPPVNHNEPAREKVRLPGERQTTPAPTTNAMRVRGMPFSATEIDVIDFFEGYGITGKVVMKQAPDGRPAGEAFVEFADLSEALRAHEELNFTGMGSRYVELLGATPEDAAMAFGLEVVSAPGKGGKAPMRPIQRSGPYGKP